MGLNNHQQMVRVMFCYGILGELDRENEHQNLRLEASDRMT
jgi:hypothetical protein